MAICRLRRAPLTGYNSPVIGQRLVIGNYIAIGKHPFGIMFCEGQLLPGVCNEHFGQFCTAWQSVEASNGVIGQLQLARTCEWAMTQMTIAASWEVLARRAQAI